MPNIDLINDTLEFAREIALQVELQPVLPTQDEILGALQVMDAQLIGSGEDTRAMFAIENAFLIPDYQLEVELMTDEEFASTLIAASVVKARPDHFEWTGNLVDSGFGLRLFGVDFVEPKRSHAPTAFVPLHAVNLRLAS